MHQHNIRQEIKVTLEGDLEHTVATSLLSIGLALKQNPRVKEIWSLDRRSTFLSYTEYPGLPDLVYSQREDGKFLKTYAVEVETNLTLKNYDKKSLQFKRLGISEVYFKDLKKCPDDVRVNWVKLFDWLMDGLP